MPPAPPCCCSPFHCHGGWTGLNWQTGLCPSSCAVLSCAALLCSVLASSYAARLARPIVVASLHPPIRPSRLCCDGQAHTGSFPSRASGRRPPSLLLQHTTTSCAAITPPPLPLLSPARPSAREPVCAHVCMYVCMYRRYQRRFRTAYCIAASRLLAAADPLARRGSTAYLRKGTDKGACETHAPSPTQQPKPRLATPLQLAAACHDVTGPRPHPAHHCFPSVCCPRDMPTQACQPISPNDLFTSHINLHQA